MSNCRRGRIVLRHPLEFDIWYYDEPPQLPTTTIIPSQHPGGPPGTGYYCHGYPNGQGPGDTVPSAFGPHQTTSYSQPSNPDQQRPYVANATPRNISRAGPVPSNYPQAGLSDSSSHTAPNQFQPERSLQHTPQTGSSQQNRVFNPPRTSSPIHGSTLRFDSSIDSKVPEGHPVTSSAPRHIIYSGEQALHNPAISAIEQSHESSDPGLSTIQHANMSSVKTLDTLNTSQVSNRTSLTSDSTSSSGSGITFKIRTKCPEEEVVERIEECLQNLLNLLRGRGVPISTFSTGSSRLTNHDPTTTTSNNYSNTSGANTSSGCRQATPCPGVPRGK